MEIIFEAPKGTRILRGRRNFCGIHIQWKEGEPLWWDRESRRWMTHEQWKRSWLTNEQGKGRSSAGCTSHAPCRSYKAFLRHLRRHADVLRGHEVTLVSRFLGHSVIAKM